MICDELDTQQNLVNLSLRKNVLRKNPKTKDFVESLTKFLQTAPAIMNLDISGMYIGDEGIVKIMNDGVANSKTLAAVNFAYNEVSHWTRIQIYSLLTMSL